ncbi:MAG: sulfotransferase [Bacteroidetes bacterium]|nr:sulfotransferase [Bacteroidota bacterium]
MIAQLTREYISNSFSKTYIRLLSYFFFEGRPATTSGRWFNPITFFFLRKASSSKIIPSAKKPVFITGTGRSGSTILGMVLSVHHQLGFMNEPKAIWNVAHHEDDLIGSYSKTEGRFYLTAADADVSVKQKVLGIYSTFLRLTGENFVVDKYPEMIFRIPFLNAIFDKPKFIFLYRNAAETISSTAKWSADHHDASASENWWGIENRKWKLILNQLVPADEYLAPHQHLINGLTSESDKAAVEWILTMNQGLKMMQQFPDQVLPVSYEALTTNATATLEKINQFCGLESDSGMLNYAQKVLHPSKGNPNAEVHAILQPAISELSLKLGYTA